MLFSFGKFSKTTPNKGRLLRPQMKGQFDTVLLSTVYF